MLTLGKIALATWLGMSQADASVTAVALSRGAYEQNPIIASAPTWVLPVVKSGAAAGSVWWSSKYLQSHPTLVFLVGAGATSFYTWSTVHNLHVIQQLPPTHR